MFTRFLHNYTGAGRAKTGIRRAFRLEKSHSSVRAAGCESKTMMLHTNS
jgi:hypothetical protein